MTGLATATVGVELLDDPAADPLVVRSSLRHIARSNRWLGGRAALRHGLGLVLRGFTPASPLTLLDVGTGAGDLPAVAERWAARRSIVLRPLGLDRSLAAAALARDGGIPAMVGCAGSLPMQDRSVDLVLVSQLIHHLRRDAAIRILQECDRVARVGVIVTDLERARLAVAGFWVAARLLRFDRPTRLDGITSVRRGYSLQEFRGLFREAGIAARCDCKPPYRLVATWRPG